MRITQLTARDVFSFAELNLPVADGLTVVTGPNGAGKSSLGRLLRLSRTALRAVARGDTTDLTREYALAGRFGASLFRVGVGLDFDEPGEREVIEHWTRAAVVSALAGAHQENATTLDAALPDHLGGSKALATGVLVVEHDAAMRNPWRVRWETAAGEVDLVYNTAGPHDAPGVTPLEWLRERGDPIAALAVADGATSTFTLAELLTAGRFELAARPTGVDAEPPSLRAAYRAVGARLDSSRSLLGLAHVLDYLLRRLVVSDEHGSGELAIVPLDALGDPGMDADPDAAIGERLLRRKTGDADMRAAFDAARDAFHSLTGADVDVVAQALERGAPDGWVLTATPVVPTATPAGGIADIPLRLSGQGLIEAARLALLLTEPAAALLLDEPATALSAVAQRRLLARLVSRAQTRQTIVITHSAHLVPVAVAASPGRIIRLTRDAEGATAVHRVREDLTEIGKHGRLLGEGDIRDALFAAAVWLVEGATDEEALRTWLTAPGSGLPTPETAHVLIISVDGAENFPRYAELMAELGIPYGILADGPALRAGRTLKWLRGAPDFNGVQDTFDDRRAAWATVGVRTLSDDYHDDKSKKGEIEAFFERTDPQVWAGIRGDSKIRRGAAFAARAPIPREVQQLWREFLADVALPAQ